MRTIISALLSLLVLLSTVSWTVEKHLCMGRVVDIAFFHHAHNCGMKMATEASGEKLKKNHCCDNESFTIQGQDDLKLDLGEQGVQSIMLVQLLPCDYSFHDFVSSENEATPEIYPPPLLVQNLTLLNQVFLI